MHELLGIWAESGRRGVMATVAEVEGHAYRKCGASMLLLEGGGRFGSISPGCLESDLEARVEGVLELRREQWVEYDMREEDDLSWGETIGCGGLIRVLLEPLNESFGQIMTELKRRLDDGEGVVLSRHFADSWSVTGYKLELAKADSAEDGRTVILQEEQGCLLQIRYQPCPRLLIFGAADDAIPVAGLAARNGFRVWVGDWREGLCTWERFPRARRFVGSPAEWIEAAKVTERDYVVVMSHHFPRDRELLARLQGIELSYLGIMGSVTRTERLLQDTAVPDWFRYPVGLRIGAAGPEEIAVSIVAELISVRRRAERNGERKGSDGETEGDRDLFGCWGKHADGALQARYRAGGRRKARRFSP
ncbi:XdhC family protein [Paenibacillus filicis]|uniref:XdhC family protein n=1 Tax=Paenibacillus gyeongsangnamensis TaxID=3388067 RepID=A0ABT4QGH9_9BACL|nr:XdhC family protein [Paenibacillus filicis]MCZ8515988.1 XdhC family protein [Paenibacillus filicis]